MIRYDIPERFLPAFEVLATLSSTETNILKQLLHDFSVGGNPRELQHALTKEKFIEDAVLMANSLFSFGELLFNNKKEDWDTLAKDLGDAYEKKASPSISNLTKEQLVKNLWELFQSSENLIQTFKAFRLLSENSHIFRQSRILTDIRPLFDETCEQVPKDALIIHRLKLEYAINNDIKEFFISLDYNDILDLEKQLKRAKEKEKQLIKTFSNLNFIQIKE